MSDLGGYPALFCSFLFHGELFFFTGYEDYSQCEPVLTNVINILSFIHALEPTCLSRLVILMIETFKITFMYNNVWPAFLEFLFRSLCSCVRYIAGLYRKAVQVSVQVCYIPNTTTTLRYMHTCTASFYSDMVEWLLHMRRVPDSILSQGKANTVPRRYKSQLVPLGSTSVLYTQHYT